MRMETDSDTASTDVESEERRSGATSSGRRSGYRFNRTYTVHTLSDSSDDGEADRRPPPPKVLSLDVPEMHEERPMCRYGSRCYRKSVSHLQQFQHPPRQQQLGDATVSDTEEDSVEKPSTSGGAEMQNNSSQLKDKYQLYLTRVEYQKASRNPEISLRDILSPKMGKLVASAQFSFRFEVDWMMAQFPEEFRSKPLLLVYGGDWPCVNVETAAFKNISTMRARLDIAYGTHHTKMMLLLYDNGLRVVIHTANMIYIDWSLKTQGVWVSSVCPPLEAEKSKRESLGESKTHFKRDLLQYLRAYRNGKLDNWVKAVVDHDFSSIRVHLIASCPGRFTGASKNSFGHLKLRHIMSSRQPRSKYPPDFAHWPVIGQFSSIGSLGADAGKWLLKEWFTTMGAPTPPRQSLPQLVYPCVEDVRKSLEGYPAGGSLPYNSKTAEKQTWLNTLLHRWKADGCQRTEAAPHIKSYCRASPGGHRASWFLLTSANLSKAAWGALEKNDSQLTIRSYELGVLFLPEDFEEDYFSLADNKDRFPFPFDLPTIKYGKTDRPWIVNLPYTKLPDRHGNMWVPT